MNEIYHLLQQIHETDSVIGQSEHVLLSDPAASINTRAIQKRRADLERRLNNELRITQSDLIQYHVERTGADRYPVSAVAKAILGFQELVTSVFDALRTAPKQRYRPSADNVELSTLDFAIAVPVGSVLVSMSIENDRLIAVKSDLDHTFERVFEVLKARDPDRLRILAEEVGISSIAKAHDWAASTSQFGLNTTISVQKEPERELRLEISNVEAQSLKDAIEEKSDRSAVPEEVVGELFGIDIDPDPNKSYFHIKTNDARNIEGGLDDAFPRDREWAVHITYAALLVKIITIKYATGEEKIEWRLSRLSPVSLSH
jgi:hypothetical protein